MEEEKHEPDIRHRLAAGTHLVIRLSVLLFWKSISPIVSTANKSTSLILNCFIIRKRLMPFAIHLTVVPSRNSVTTVTYSHGLFSLQSKFIYHLSSYGYFLSIVVSHVIPQSVMTMVNCFDTESSEWTLVCRCTLHH